MDALKALYRSQHRVSLRSDRELCTSKLSLLVCSTSAYLLCASTNIHFRASEAHGSSVLSTEGDLKFHLNFQEFGEMLKAIIAELRMSVLVCQGSRQFLTY